MIQTSSPKIVLSKIDLLISLRTPNVFPDPAGPNTTVSSVIATILDFIGWDTLLSAFFNAEGFLVRSLFPNPNFGFDH